MGNMFGRGFESHQLHKPACGETAEQRKKIKRKLEFF
jgi:hypothetical protein